MPSQFTTSAKKMPAVHLSGVRLSPLPVDESRHRTAGKFDCRRVAVRMQEKCPPVCDVIFRPKKDHESTTGGQSDCNCGGDGCKKTEGPPGFTYRNLAGQSVESRATSTPSLYAAGGVNLTK